ncbi:MAG TPA: alpha-E domain-containing protein, partial [Roseiflexaceae bacterium]|nr:alpha-E domain-containing protein [Roseiflexaceae bacterium]
DKTVRILDVKYSALSIGDAADGASLASLQWIALLKSCSAFEPYRQSHTQLQAWRIADFLLLDRTFPRSVTFCLEQTHAALQRISGSSAGRPANAAERMLGRLCADLMYQDIREMLGDLHTYLDTLEARINDVGDALAQTYFVLNIIPPPDTSIRYQEAQQQQ